MQCVASTSAAGSRSPASRPTTSIYDPATVETCEELQHDELLALEAIYEEHFASEVNSHGERVLRVRLATINLQDEREVIVVEEGIPVYQAESYTSRPVLCSTPLTTRRPARCKRGRGGNQQADATRSRGRGGRQNQAHGEHRGHNDKAKSTAEGHCCDQEDTLSVTLASSIPSAADPTRSTRGQEPTRAERRAKLLHLPAVDFVATLPRTYPTESPPLIELHSNWINENIKQTLRDKLLPLWQGDASLYLMLDELTTSIESGILGDPIRFHDHYSLSATPAARTSLFSTLTTHDRLLRNSTFSAESFDCGICLETKKGTRCSKIRSCGHVFCIECLYSFFEINIREGTVKNVCCADQDCVKARDKGHSDKGSVSLEELVAIVGKELADRYEWLVEKQKLESDPTITYCPREACNAPVQKETDETYERLRVCPACGYSFCVYCRRTYHGTKSRCVFSQASSIIDKYVNGSDEEKAALQRKYGKNNVEKMVEAYLEEQANAKWIEENSTRCPGCQLDIERSQGCAHILCQRCQVHFCYNCGCRLNKDDPYSHYSTKTSPCYNKLFPYQPSEDVLNEALFEAMMA